MAIIDLDSHLRDGWFKTMILEENSARLLGL